MTADPLPSWNDCGAKRGILSFLARVTDDASPDFVPLPERVAVFDNDGTLWPENPIPFQAAFGFDELRRRVDDEAALDPEVRRLKQGGRDDADDEHGEADEDFSEHAVGMG